MTGRWEASLPDGSGGRADCILDVQSNGQAKFTDSCPFPLGGNSTTIGVVEGNTYAPGVFRPGDSGTFTMLGGQVHNAVGSYLLKGKRLTLRGPQFGDSTWKKISSSKPLKNDIDDIIPDAVNWPIEDLPRITRAATSYVRAHWQKDAVLLSVTVKLLDGAPSYTKLTSPAGALELNLGYYSPDTQEGIQLSPGAMYSPIFSFGVVDWRADRALPDNYVDLPDAVNVMRQSGMRAKQIKEAELRDWGQATYAGNSTLSGVEWRIRSALDEYGVVRATR